MHKWVDMPVEQKRLNCSNITFLSFCQHHTSVCPSYPDYFFKVMRIILIMLQNNPVKNLKLALHPPISLTSIIMPDHLTVTLTGHTTSRLKIEFLKFVLWSAQIRNCNTELKVKARDTEEKVLDPSSLKSLSKFQFPALLRLGVTDTTHAHTYKQIHKHKKHIQTHIWPCNCMFLYYSNKALKKARRNTIR